MELMSLLLKVSGYTKSAVEKARKLKPKYLHVFGIKRAYLNITTVKPINKTGIRVGISISKINPNV